jgi:hypothetical protein
MISHWDNGFGTQRSLTCAVGIPRRALLKITNDVAMKHPGTWMCPAATGGGERAKVAPFAQLARGSWQVNASCNTCISDIHVGQQDARYRVI